MSCEAETQQPPARRPCRPCHPCRPHIGTAKDKVIAMNVLGTVKWFNVRNGYSFINRNDTKEDVFVHQTAIKKNDPRMYLRSVRDGDCGHYPCCKGPPLNHQQNYQNTESGEKKEGSESASEDQAQQRRPYSRRRFPPYFTWRPYACRPKHSNPPCARGSDGGC